MNLKNALIIIAFVFFVSTGFGQKIVLPASTCFYYDVAGTAISTGFDFRTEDDAENIISAIIDVVGLKPNFTVRAAKVPNAAAVILKGERYILYSPGFISQMDKASNSRWASISILAHEIGHHLNGHTLMNTGSRPDLELEADEFSGFVLRKMGATVQESQLAMAIAASQKASHTHPAKASRLVAIDKGWKHADTQMSGERSVSIEKMKKPDRKVVIDEKEKQSVLEKKFIKYEVNFNFDPNGIYYVTIRNNLVKIDGSQIIVLGKLAETSASKFPYVLYQSDKNYLFVSKNGIIVTSKGEKAGYMKS
jgi:hypothetical protein